MLIVCGLIGVYELQSCADKNRGVGWGDRLSDASGLSLSIRNTRSPSMHFTTVMVV